MNGNWQKLPATHRIGWLTTAVLLCALFWPMIVREGMFMDGLIYAAIASRYALSQGSAWLLPFPGLAESGDLFLHPPLKIWLESAVFRLFDAQHWAMERIWCTVEWLSQIILIAMIWRQMFQNDDARKSNGWLPLLLWFSIPVVHWSFPNNMLENTMGIFTLLSVWFFLKMRHERPFSGAILVGIALAGAAMTKGPVGLFPLAMPVCWQLAHWRKNDQKLTRNQLVIWLLIPALTLSAVLALLFQSADAQVFLSKYWAGQIVQSVDGTGEMSEKGLGAHFQLLWILVQEIVIPVVFLAVVWFIQRKKGENNTQSANGPIIFWLLLFACAVLPLLASTKQRGFYLLPGLPFLALAAAAVGAAWFSRISAPTRAGLWIRVLAGCFVIIFGISAYLAGKSGRDHDIVAEMHHLQKALPSGGYVKLCQSEWDNYALHAYVFRYGPFQCTVKSEGVRATMYKRNSCRQPESQNQVFIEGDWYLEIFQENNTTN